MNESLSVTMTAWIGHFPASLWWSIGGSMNTQPGVRWLNPCGLGVEGAHEMLASRRSDYEQQWGGGHCGLVTWQLPSANLNSPSCPSWGP